LVAGVTVLSSLLIARANEGPGYDLVPMSIAGRLVATSQVDHLYGQDPLFYNLVDDSVYRRAAADVGFSYAPTPFVYPPLIAVGMRPLAWLRFTTVRQAWTLLSLALTFLSIMLVIHLYLPEWSKSWKLGLVLFALCAFEPLLYGFWLGQTTAIILPMVTGAMILQRRDRYWAAGLVLALATFIKLTPIVIAVTWLWRGPRRAFIWTLAGLGALWGLSIAIGGIALNMAYVERVRAIGRSALVAYNNHSLLTFYARPLTEPAAWRDWRLYEPPTAAVVASAISLLVLLVAAIACFLRSRSNGCERGRRTAEGFALLLTLLGPTIAWTHYFVFLLPVIAIVFAQTRALGARVLAVSAFMLCCWPLLPVQHVQTSSELAIRVAGPTLAALILWADLTWIGLTDVR
jgi:hypothetical protein